jgi:hypothetical protein
MLKKEPNYIVICTILIPYSVTPLILSKDTNKINAQNDTLICLFFLIN